MMIDVELILGGILVGLFAIIFVIKKTQKSKEILFQPVTSLKTNPSPPQTPPLAEKIIIDPAPVLIPEIEIVEIEKKTPVLEVKNLPKQTPQCIKIHPNLPQDSTLRRHYLTHLTMMLETICLPRPTDSTLKRHYQNMISAKIETCLDHQEKMAQLVTTYSSQKIPCVVLEEKPLESPEEIVIDLPPVLIPEIEMVEVKKETPQSIKIHPNLPQDSILRRHYLAHLTMIVETVYPPCPTDSVLKRHYQNMISAKIENCLDHQEKMAQLLGS